MRKPLKSHKILLELVRGNSLNRFEAAKLGDWCLNTTIATLQRKLNIFIDRQREDVPCRVGQVSVCRYSIPESHRKEAAGKLAADLVRHGFFKDEQSALASIGIR